MRSTVATSAMLLSIVISPVPAAAQRAGTLISADPIVETPDGMQAWKVSYWTSSGNGRPVQATGIVAAPREAIPAQPRKVLAWIRDLGRGVEVRAVGKPQFLERHAGFGRGEEWLCRRCARLSRPRRAGGASLPGRDRYRPVGDRRGSRRPANPRRCGGQPIRCVGELQGGHAALWTAQVAARYAPDLQLVGAAAAAPPTDLVQNLRLSPNKQVRTFFTAYIGYTWNKHYGAPLTAFGNAQSRGILTRLAQNNCIELNSKPKLGTVLGVVTLQSRWKNLDLGRVQPWARLAQQNSPSNHGFGGLPLLISQNPKDDLVAPSVTRTYAKAVCRAGQRVRWVEINAPAVRPARATVRRRRSAGSTIASRAARCRATAAGFSGRPLLCACRTSSGRRASSGPCSGRLPGRA